MRSKFLLFAFLIITATSISLFAQAKDRVIRADRPTTSEPAVLEVTGMKINGSTVALNELCVADAGWLRNLTITLKNVGERNLICVGLSVGPLAEFDTKGNCDSLTKTKTPIVLKKGVEIDLKYDEAYWIHKGLREDHWDDYRKAILDYGYVVYEDGEKSDVILRFPADTKFPEGRSH